MNSLVDANIMTRFAAWVDEFVALLKDSLNSELKETDKMAVDVIDNMGLCMQAFNELSSSKIAEGVDKVDPRSC